MCWLFAYAHAQRVGAEFVCSPWIGEDIFSLPKYGRPTKACEQFPVFSEMNLCEDYTNIRITAYAQSEKATRLYTREQAREWLQLRLDPHDLLAAFASGPQYRVVGHLRRGDFVGYSGYPLVSLGSYERCIATFKLNAHLSANFETFLLVSELCPRYITVLPKHLSFLPDFMTLVTAPILLRANSSFSWVAGLLNTGRVFSPIITQRMRGAVDNDCEFVESNHPRLTWIEGCGDLRLKGQP
jgi:hypothetical protein